MKGWECAFFLAVKTTEHLGFNQFYTMWEKSYGIVWDIQWNFKICTQFLYLCICTKIILNISFYVSISR